MIEAAGGIVRRAGAAPGGVEVLVVHRPRYDDWTLPKGKLDPGEAAEDAARREVTEETGHECTLGPLLAEVRYRDRYDRDKRVRYWAMAVVGGAFEPNDEVDEVRWMPAAEVPALLTYERDAALVADLLERGLLTPAPDPSP